MRLVSANKMYPIRDYLDRPLSSLPELRALGEQCNAAAATHVGASALGAAPAGEARDAAFYAGLEEPLAEGSAPRRSPRRRPPMLHEGARQVGDEFRDEELACAGRFLVQRASDRPSRLRTGAVEHD